MADQQSIAAIFFLRWQTPGKDREGLILRTNLHDQVV